MYWLFYWNNIYIYTSHFKVASNGSHLSKITQKGTWDLNEVTLWAKWPFEVFLLSCIVKLIRPWEAVWTFGWVGKAPHAWSCSTCGSGEWVVGCDDEGHGAILLFVISEFHIKKLIEPCIKTFSWNIGVDAMGNEQVTDAGTFMKNLTDEGQSLDQI